MGNGYTSSEDCCHFSKWDSCCSQKFRALYIAPDKVLFQLKLNDIFIATDKRGYPHNIFLSSPRKQMWYSLEAPWWGIFNEYPQHMFSWRNKKDIRIFWMKKAPYLLPWFFLLPHKNIYCGYSLEVLWWGTSNDYPQHMFLWRNKKSIIWICLPLKG